MELTRPIILIGNGRSGSTIFHKILSRHPELTWLSFLNDHYPNKPAANQLYMKVIDIPLLGNYLTKKRGPSEPYFFWDHYCRGFSTPFRDLKKEDVLPKSKENVRAVLSENLTKKRHRLLLKITGWPRIGYLREIFPDAIFIYVKRNPIAIANSLLNVDFWWGWRGPHNWRMGLLPDKYQKIWDKYDNSFVALAAIEYLLYNDAYQKSVPDLTSESLFELPYDALCQNPIDTLKMTTEKCDLIWNQKFEARVSQFKLVNNDHKWKNNLTLEQQNTLSEILDNYV